MQPLTQLTEALARLPGIGRKTAERLAVFLARDPNGVAQQIAEAVETARAQLLPCQQCGNVTSRDENPCRLCSNPRRDTTMLCIVEDPSDITLIERSGEYNGRYFALMGKLSPMRGEGLGSLRLPQLLDRIAELKDGEVLLALNCDVESEATASYLRHIISQKYPKATVTRLALGIPAGSAIAFSDPVTLGRAIKGRTQA